MSLKSFHIFFVVVSILFCLGFSGWEVSEYLRDGKLGQLLGSVAAFLSAAGLVYYLVNVIKKFRTI